MNTKKIRMDIILILIMSIISIIFIYNDDFLYKDEIMKITSIKINNTIIKKNYIGFKEKHMEESITGIITNGRNKGKKIVIDYEETYSSVVTDKYRVNDKVFIKNNNIEGLKRDVYISILVLIFINLIYIVGKYKGILSIVSVIFNFIIFYLGLNLYFKGINILFICIVESVIFSCLSLFISNGFEKMSISAVLSVVVTILFIMIMTFIISKVTNYRGINFNELKFLTVPPEDILLPELLIGSIGAVMDVAITISSSINELINKNSRISIKNLNKSSKEIGKDIMSTMCNVLFFTYLGAGLPIYVLAIRNGYSVSNFIKGNFSLELTRFLVGGIGIIMSIPITTYISVNIFKKGDNHE